MTNDRRNSNSHCYTSEIKTFEPIMLTKEKEKLEHVENFRSSKYRNCNSNVNTIENSNRGNIKKIGNEANNKEKNMIKINNENINSNNENIIVNEGKN